jgi:hypothetical protein
MKNSMQDVYIKFQKDANGKPSFFKEILTGESVNPETGARTVKGKTMLVFRTEIEGEMNVLRGRSNNDKVRQAPYYLDYLDREKAHDYLEKRLTPKSQAKLNLLGYEDIFYNPETLNKAVASNLKLCVKMHIGQQEFRVNLFRYKAGKHAECINSYKQCLARYADFNIFQTKFLNHIISAVASVDEKLLETTLRDATTDLFNVALIDTLDADVQAKIALELDTIMFGKKVKKDGKDIITVGAKLKVFPNTLTPIKSADTKEYIVSYKYTMDTDKAMELYPDTEVIESDRTDTGYVAFKASEKQQSTASKLETLSEQTSEEPKAVTLPAGDVEEEETEE